MIYSYNGQELRLRRLSDPEYEEAERMARTMGVSLYVCPTCDNDTRVAHVKPITPTYRYRGKEHECNCQVQIALFTRYLLANIGEQYMRLDWADFDGSETAQGVVRTYLSKWQNFKKAGWGIEFGGPLGIGKTFAATHIGKELIKRGQKVSFIPFSEMVSAFERQDGEAIERRLREQPFVILDEILPARSERQADFYATRFEALIRHRTNHNLVTIITTNLSEDELNKAYPRTYSLLAAKQQRVDMSGQDARKSKMAIENLELIMNDEVRPIT